MDILVNLGFFLLGAALSLIILWYQDRVPNLHVKCELSTDGDPSRIRCVIENSGRAEARDVFVGFNKMLPTGTTLISDAQMAAELIPSNNPPDPNVFRASAEFRQAFAVKIPRVPPSETVEFQVITRDSDNQRAAKQMMRLWQRIRTRLSHFGDRLLEDHPELEDRWDLDAFMSALSRRDNFYTPGRFSYEGGTHEVSFITVEQKLADATIDDLTRRYESDYPEHFKQESAYKAPVIRISILDGHRTFASAPPFVNTKTEFRVPGSQLLKGKPIYVEPAIPDSYD